MTHVYYLLTMALDVRTGLLLWQGAPRNCDRPSGGARKKGRVKIGLRLWLHAAQQGLCPVCGSPIADALDSIGVHVSHVVGQGPKNRGYVPGNVYLSHARCNVGQATESFERGIRYGSGITRAEYLAQLADMAAGEFALTAIHEFGYSLILTPADFARPELIPMEWPCETTGGFIYFDPAFEGIRKL